MGEEYIRAEFIDFKLLFEKALRLGFYSLDRAD